jgi:mono/diheme cytochrome c family protein
MNALKIAVIAALLGLSIVACSQSSAPTNSPAPTNTASTAPPAAAVTPIDVLASGKELYATNCQICHKDTGKGGKVTVDGKKLDPIDLTSDKMKKHDNAKLMEHISEGAPDDGMPAFKDKLTRDEIKEIVVYVRSLQGA